MPARFPIPLILLLALAPLPARGLVAAGDPCSGDDLPYVLNLGLPRLPGVSGLPEEAPQQRIGELIKAFYARHGLCPQRKLQVNIAVAGDYEILDWLGQGLIDAAVVPDLTVYLLTQRDSTPLREMEIADLPAGNVLLPASSYRPLSRRLSGGSRQAGDPRQDFAAFLAASWRQAQESSARDPARPAPGYRVVFASHLSTPGFLVPVAGAARWLAERTREIAKPKEKDRLAERFWQTFFASARFAVDCVSPGCWQPAGGARDDAGAGGGGELVEILFPGENARQGSMGRAPGSPEDAGSREHLVIASRTADSLFSSGLRDAAVQLPQPLENLFNAKNPPAPFLAMLDVEPSFGVRTFGFTVDETFRLLRQNQVASKRTNLALVLPGGGVKAAYQSKIIDELYQRRYLKNSPAPAATPGEPLAVKYVIGTSGGALLGFFVSQLRDEGPWDLSEILWKKPGRFHKGDRFLESTDIFNWTDLLRYASLVASFLMFCALLAVVSIPERMPFRPARKEPSSRFRPWLMRGMFLLLVLAPFLVRRVNGDSVREQIPEFEGMIYALLAMMAVFADQSILHEEEERGEGHGGLWAPPLLVLAAGALLVAVPLAATVMRSPFDFLTGPVTFGPAFAGLAPLVLLGGLILPIRFRQMEKSWRGWLRLALEFLVPAGLAIGLYFLLPDPWLDAIKMPFFLAGFLLVLMSLGTNLFLSRYATPGDWRWWLVYYTALVVSALLLLTLCWQPEQANPAPARAQDSFEVTGGTFLLCVGLLLSMVGWIAWVYARHRRYHLRLREILPAYFVALLHAVTVYLVLFAVIKLLPDWLSPLELTLEFWGWLLITSFVLGSLLIGLGARRSQGIGYLRSSFELLCSHHPNGDFVTRRFLRMAVFAVFVLFWWNLIMAPALYGNRSAHRYLESAIARFEQRTGASGDGLHYQPTARFIAPANLLEKDGTRYFLFVPPGSDCRSFVQQPASGAKWLPYEVRLDKLNPAARRGCYPIPYEEFLHDVIFASGSPFPIFPAHRLTLKEGEEPLVDGGYSNNIPVDVAAKVAADQVLIVDSSSALTRPSPQTFMSRLFHLLIGDLVRNLSRLPGFLFERSQQVDRLSRHDLLVISLAPSPDEPDWPPLFDFRGKTVQRMEDTAERDFQRRIGLVESWGLPRFQLSVPVEGSRPPSPSAR